MAIIGTYNGASILALPPRPAWKQVELIMNDTVADSRSPFTGTSQMQAWPGADWWEANLTLPQMVQTDAQVWTAFLGECRGKLNCFFLTDLLHVKPAGSARGIPVVAGTNVAMATSLTTRGWLKNQFGALLPGDQLQLGNRLHRVLNPVNADANGMATIDVWPSLRETVNDGFPVNLNNPQGLFRLAENRRSVLTTETLLSGISLKCMEAR